MTVHSTSSVRLNGQIVITKPVSGQMVSGWISSTQTDADGQIFYGPFTTIEQAADWAKNLVNATIEPVYYPSYNAG